MEWVDGYRGTTLRHDVTVERIFTVHYFEYTVDFAFPGERHRFWELVYVDNGMVEVTAGERRHTLLQGDMIFHEPDEFHDLRAAGTTAPNLVVVSFSSVSPAMRAFVGKVVRVTSRERNLLGQIIQEAQAAFSSPLDDPHSVGLDRAAHAPFGAEQLVQLSLEELLIRVLRRKGRSPCPDEDDRLSSPEGTIAQRCREAVFDKVVRHLERTMSRPVNLGHVCRAVGYSRSYLYRVFSELTGHGVTAYATRLKVEHAKRLIREGHLNLSQICEGRRPDVASSLL